MTETTTLPKEPLVEHLVAEAYEGGIEEHVGPTERGVDADVEWSLDDVDEWTVGYHGDGQIEAHGIVTGRYAVQERSATYNPPGQAHPAEYRTETIEIGVTLVADWSEEPLGGVTGHAEVL